MINNYNGKDRYADIDHISSLPEPEIRNVQNQEVVTHPIPTRITKRVEPRFEKSYKGDKRNTRKLNPDRVFLQGQN